MAKQRIPWRHKSVSMRKHIFKRTDGAYASRAGKFGVPNPVTGSQPLAAVNPTITDMLVFFRLEVKILKYLGHTSSATGVCSAGDIMESCWVCIKYWVYETDGLLSSCETHFVDSNQDGSEARCCCWCSADKSFFSADENSNVVLYLC